MTAFLPGDIVIRHSSHSLTDPTGARRLTEKVILEGDCIRWTGAHDSHGYGHIRIQGRTRKTHQIAYELTYGPVPDGLEIDHVAARGCRFHDCCNPSHLEAVTHAENVRRAMVKSHCNSGHEYTPDNTYVRPNGSRLCRTCQERRANCPDCGHAVTARHLAEHRGAKCCRAWQRELMA